MFLSGFCHFGLVNTWFCDRDLTLPSCLVFLWAHDLSSVCFVSWWSFGSRHLCLVQVLVPGRGLDTHAPCSFLLWECAVSSSLGPCAPLSTWPHPCYLIIGSFTPPVFPRYFLICSLFILLVFAVLCQFVVECCVCLVSCPALSYRASLFSPMGWG